MKKILLLVVMVLSLFVAMACDDTSSSNYKYEIAFETNGGESITNLYANDVMNEDFPVPTYENHFFVGWYMDEALTIPFSKEKLEAGSNTLYANWVEDEQYDLTLVKMKSINDEHHFIQVETNGSTFIALTDDHRIFGWGGNHSHLLGWSDQMIDASVYPYAVELTDVFELNQDEYIVDMAVGMNYTLFLTNNGSAYGLGRNSVYQMGADPQEHHQPYNFTDDLSLEENETIIDVIAVNLTTFLVTDINRILRLGNGFRYDTTNESFVCEDVTENISLDDGDSIKKVLTVKFGDFLVLTEKGRVFAYQSNKVDGFLEIDSESLIEITHYFSLNQNEMIEDISTNMNFDIFRTNENRYLFLGYSVDRYFSNLDTTGPITDITAEFNLETGESIRKLCVENRSNLFVTTTLNRVLFYGWRSSLLVNLDYSRDNYDGYDLTSVFPLHDQEVLIDIKGFYENSVVLTSEGRILTWGDIAYALGDFSIRDQYFANDVIGYFDLNDSEEIVDVMYGGYRNTNGIVYTSQNRVFVWGKNEYGLLGFGNKTTIYPAPYEITDMFGFHDGETIQKMDVSHYQAVLLTSEGRVFIWGENIEGLLGVGNEQRLFPVTEITDRIPYDSGDSIVDVFAEAEITMFMTDNGILYGCGNGTYTPAGAEVYTDIVEPGEKIIETTGFGSNHMLLTDNNRILTIGYNYYGQIGDGTTDRRYGSFYDVTQQIPLEPNENIKDMVYHNGTCIVLTSKGRTYIWGNNQDQIVYNQDEKILTPMEYVFADVFETDKIIDVEMADDLMYFFTENHDVYLYRIDNRHEEMPENLFEKIGVTNRFYKINTDTMVNGESIRDMKSTSWNVTLVTDTGFYSFGSDMIGIQDNQSIELIHEPVLIEEEMITYNYMERLDTNHSYYVDNTRTHSYERVWMPRRDLTLYVEE